MTSKIFALIGPRGSGKSLLASMLIANQVHFIPHYTTHRLTKGTPLKDFCHHVDRWDFPKEDFVVRITRQGEYYGTRKDDVLDALEHHKRSVMLLDPAGIPQLSRVIKGSLSTIFLMVDYFTIISRLLRMGYSSDEMKYQLQYAETNREFDNWKLTDYVVKNTREPKEALIQIMAIMGMMKPTMDWNS